MNKKVLSVLLVAAMALSAVACSKDNGGNNNNSNSNMNSNSGDKTSSAVLDNEYFNISKNGPYYELDGLTDKGMKQETLVIPAGVIISGSIRDGVVKHISFESDEDVEIYSFFSTSTTLETIELPANMTRLCSFSNCTALKEITIPKLITSIPDTFFSGDVSLEKVVIEGNVTEIGNQAFKDCKSLKEINIPDSVTSIGNWAFHGCESLTEVTLPSGLKTIGELAFSDIGLQTIIVPADMELETWDSAAFVQLNESYSVKVKEGSWADIHFDEVFQGQAIKEYY